MTQISSSSEKTYTFIPARQSDSRSPCPALNALANHGYLYVFFLTTSQWSFTNCSIICLLSPNSPRNGKRISVPQLVRAMHNIYRTSFPLSIFLSVVGAALCGNGWYINLDDLALHNKIEHDASLTHANAGPENVYAPSVPDPSLIEQMLALSPGDHLTLDDLIAYRAIRDSTLSTPLSFSHRTIAFGEIAFIYELFADEQKCIPKQLVRQWFAEERLPDGWSGPSSSLSLWHTTVNNQHIQAAVKKLEKQKKAE